MSAIRVYLNTTYSVTFTTNTVTITWDNPIYGTISFTADDINFVTSLTDATMVTISSTTDQTTLLSTKCNDGPFASAALLIAFINGGIIASGSVSSLSAGQGITLTPDPITTTGTIAVSNLGITTGMLANNSVTLAKMATQAATTLLGNATGSAAVPSALTLTAPLAFSGSSVIHSTIGTAGTYTNPSSITTNATGHITSITSGSGAFDWIQGYSAFKNATSGTNFVFDTITSAVGTACSYNSGTDLFTLPAGTYLMCCNVTLSDKTDPGASFGASLVHVNGGGVNIGVSLTLGYGHMGAYTGDYTGSMSCESMKVFSGSATVALKPFCTTRFSETNVFFLKIA